MTGKYFIYKVNSSISSALTIICRAFSYTRTNPPTFLQSIFFFFAFRIILPTLFFSSYSSRLFTFPVPASSPHTRRLFAFLLFITHVQFYRNSKQLEFSLISFFRFHFLFSFFQSEFLGFGAMIIYLFTRLLSS